MEGRGCGEAAKDEAVDGVVEGRGGGRFDLDLEIWNGAEVVSSHNVCLWG